MKSHRIAALVLCTARALLLGTIAIAQTPSPSSALVVTVRGSANRPVAGAHVQVDTTEGTPKLDVVTKDDGTYRGPALAPGHYGIVVTAPCYERFQGTLDVDSGRPSNTLITLTASQGAVCAASAFEYADSSGLKAGELSGAPDAAGYSSQAEARTPEIREALADIIAGPQNRAAAESETLHRGASLLRAGKYQQAADTFRDGAGRDPASSTMLLALGVAYYAGGHYDEAAESLCKAADLNAADARPYFFLSHSDWSSTEEGAAILQRLKANAARHPRDASAQYEYALALQRAQTLGETGIDATQVQQLLRSAVALDDSFAEAHFELGVVLSATDSADAAREFQRAIALQPDWADAHYRLSQLYSRAGAGDKARLEIALYERLRQRGPAAQQQRLRDELRRLTRNL